MQKQRYPLTYFAALYLNRRPGTVLNALPQELLRFVSSSQGQQLMTNAGFVPLSAAMAHAELQRVGLSRTPPRHE